MSFDNCDDVRIATPDDMQPIYDLMMLAHEECGEHKISPEKVLHKIALATHRQASLIGVVGPSGERVLKGYVLLIIEPVWYSDDYQLLEVSNFVHPDHRRSDYAKQLIVFSKRCAENLALDLTMGVYSNERTEAKVRLYRRQLPPVGAFFCYKPHKEIN
jgi:GNAT superfamily N-acetyltransferase